MVTLFKLMHGVSIPLVADKAALGKSTVHGYKQPIRTFGCLACGEETYADRVRISGQAVVL